MARVLAKHNIIANLGPVEVFAINELLHYPYEDEPAEETKTKIPDKVLVAYSVFKKITGELSGNSDGHSNTYGELSMYSTQKLVNNLEKNDLLDGTSIFIDVGSGLFKVVVHFNLAMDCLAYGFEVRVYVCNLTLPFTYSLFFLIV